ncbi:MAG: sodium:solute symporter [Prolixibacteraceae bacterium]
MSPTILLSFLISYFLVLLVISWFTSRNSSDNSNFFIANRNSKWYLVAIGMIGTNLSGVTFISVPGAVGSTGFGYFQFVLGNAVGYLIIALVLLPIYYRIRLISIYTYLEKRFGFWSYKSGAMIFLVSRTIGSSLRLYIVGIVLYQFIFKPMHVPFWLTIFICLGLIWLYTFKGGLKTIIITDTLQTVFLITSVLLSILFISRSLGMNVFTLIEELEQSPLSQVFFWDDLASNRNHFLKNFLGGIFITIAMNGLDQDIMQKNLSCRNLKDAQKNMFSFIGVFTFMNIFFLSVGVLLYKFAAENGIDVNSLQTPDHLFPEIALNHLSTVPSMFFMLGITAATFAATDSALTSLTTSFCIDFLGFGKKKDQNSKELIYKRQGVHVALSLIMLAVILFFRLINNDSVVLAIFKAAGYTYGPLLGLFAFGVLCKRSIKDKAVPFICFFAPFLTYIFDRNSFDWIGYSFGFEIIIVNSLITYFLISITSQKESFKLAGV